MDESPWAETLHVSKSQLATYLQCSRRYAYQYVHGAPWEAVPAALVFGHAMHRAVAFYYQRRQARLTATAEDLEAVFQLAWDEQRGDLPLIFSRGVTEAALRDQGGDLLRCFLTHVKPRTIAAVEKPFAVDLVDPDSGEILPLKLVGSLDLVEADDEGTVIVAELKTAARAYGERQSEHLLDGAVYGYAVEQLGMATTPEQVLVRFDVLVKTRTPQFEQYYVTKDPGDFRKFRRLAAGITRAVALQVFVPHEGWYCASCPFQRRCAADQRR